ncbi:cytochrome P450 [Granulosicoccus sp.]|nr:cytochrome P450 [Granulosicoccus sp.]
MQKTQPDIKDFDLRSLPQAFYDNPYPWYRSLREQQPVRRMPDGSVLLTRYTDIQSVYKSPMLFSSDKRAEFKPKYGDSPLYEHHTSSLVFNDPPLHSRVRNLIAGAMHPRAITAMEKGLIKCVDELLDKLERSTQPDLITDYAMQIPIEIIGNMLAIPRDEREPLREWSLAILGALEPANSERSLEQGNQSVQDFIKYLDKLVERRRREPGDPDKDVLTRLIQGEDGDTLSRMELLHNCIFILNAGHETTTNLIGNGLYLLSENPDQRVVLQRQPELIKTAVEEMLRLESSNQLGNRITTESTTIGAETIEAGTPITLCIGAANRDPAQFTNPDRMDIQRSPNRHLAFGSGIHQCAGVSLAKLEGQVAIGRFLMRFPDFQLLGSAKRSRRARFRGFLNMDCLLG